MVFSLAAFAIFSCSKRTFSTNGETIYRTGKNQNGEMLFDKNASNIKFANSCVTCHGKNGDRMSNVSVRFSYLADPQNYTVPYNDTLFFRFIDHDLKSDGTKANIGVTWKMNDRDKKDLLAYLKTL